MDWHIIAIGLFIILNGVLGFFVTHLYNKMDSVERRVGVLEVNESGIKVELKYIREGIDDIKTGIHDLKK